MPPKKRLWKWLLSLGAALLVIRHWFLFWRVAPNKAGKKSNPTKSYAEAVERVKALQALDDETINPVAHTKLLTHGKKTKKVVVFFHGYTNCPEQFRPLGEMLFKKAYNVFIPRLPYNGLLDRLTTLQRKLTASDLLRLTRESLDIAQGLGEQVVVCGLSAGGCMAAWAAQHRNDVDLALILAPSLGYHDLSAKLTPLVTPLLFFVPNFFHWWDTEKKQNMAGPVYAYPRFASRVFGEIFRFSEKIRRQAKKDSPKAKKIIMVTSAADTAVNQDLIDQLMRSWKEKGAKQQVGAYEFPLAQNVYHDMIDPNQPYEQVKIVYPKLIELIEEN